MDQRYLGLLDMLNGGGAGRAGQTFEGGGLSGLLNSLGIRPMGYQDRLSEARPQPNPILMTPTVSTMGMPPVADNYAYVAGRPDMAGPAPTMPNTLGGISMPGQPSLTEEQIIQLLMDLNLMPQAPMSASPRMPTGENYDPMARGAGVFSTGYGPR
jgi:hypothetical protein